MNDNSRSASENEITTIPPSVMEIVRAQFAKDGDLEAAIITATKELKFSQEWGIPCLDAVGPCRKMFPDRKMAEAVALTEGSVLEQRLVGIWTAVPMAYELAPVKP